MNCVPFLYLRSSRASFRLLAGAALLAMGPANAVALAPPVPDVAPATLDAVQAEAQPFDAHLDIPADFDPAHADQRGTGQWDLAAAAQGGVRGGALALFAPQEAESADALARARALIEKKYAIITAIAADFPTKAAIAHSPEEYRAIVASGRFAIVISVVNGGGFVTSPADIDDWARRGVRLFGFVHAGHNILADSSRPASARGEPVERNHGLSPLGRQVLARLNDRGILVDVSQLSDAAFQDVLRQTRAPVIASHSDVRTLVDATRNLSDAELDAIKANNGVVGINAFPAYLRARSPQTAQALKALAHDYGQDSTPPAPLPPDRAQDYAAKAKAIHAAEPKATLVDLVNALDYVVKRIGIDHVALSTDFNHGGGIIGWQNEGDARNVTAELLRRGYSPADIRKIWSGNFLRVWQAARTAAR